MARPKKNKKQEYQVALNEIEDIKADEMRDLMDLNFKIKCKFKSKKQRELADVIKKNRITIVSGSAGTGKSFIALKTALELLKDSNSGIGDILLSTPIVEISPNSIGALPGDLSDKTFNYFQHFYDNIEKIVGTKVMKFLKSSDLVSDKIVNFIRGATFGKIDDDGNPIGTMCIFDECFVGDTRISIEFKDSNIGYRYTKIKDIYDNFNKGIEIMLPSYNTDTNEIEYKKIINVFKNLDRNIMDVYFKGITKLPMRVTKNHPLSVFKNGEIEWLKVSELKEDDIILKYKRKKSNNANLVFADSYDILLGFMLGGGSLLKNKQKSIAYRLTKTHGLKQEEYVLFCKNIFGNAIIRKGLKSGYTGKPLCGFQTKSLIIDKEFMKSVKKDDVKYLSKDIEKYFTLRTLALWYMDSGYYHKKAKHIIMNTLVFDESEINILTNILKNKFNFNVSVDKIDNRKGDGRKYHMIRIHKESSKNMLLLIKDLLHPTMLYKSEFTENKFNLLNYKIEKSDNLTASYIDYFKDSGAIEDTYNIEVEDNNNYFVKKSLVHNCQNFLPSEVKAIISRLGEGSKILLLGDLDQCDLKLRKGEINGLQDAVNRFKDMDGIGYFEFTEDDIVRDKFLIEIMKRYKN